LKCVFEVCVQISLVRRRGVKQDLSGSSGIFFDAHYLQLWLLTAAVMGAMLEDRRMSHHTIGNHLTHLPLSCASDSSFRELGGHNPPFLLSYTRYE